MASGEGKRGVGQACSKGLGSACVGCQYGEVVGVEADAVAARHDGPRRLLGPGALHRTLDLVLHLHDLGPGPEEAGGRALEHTLEEALEISKGWHGGWNRTRGGRKTPTGLPVGTGGTT